MFSFLRIFISVRDNIYIEIFLSILFLVLFFFARLLVLVYEFFLCFCWILIFLSFLFLWGFFLVILERKSAMCDLFSKDYLFVVLFFYNRWVDD